MPWTSHPHALDLLRSTPYGRVGLSRNALPFVTVTRHIVSGPALLARVHRGLGHHTACDGAVVAYEADNLGHGTGRVWSVHVVGTAHLDEPSPAELELLGPLPDAVDGDPYVPAYLRLEPRFVTVHHLDGVPVRAAAG